MLDFNAVREKKKTFADLARGLSARQLHKLTDEMVDEVLDIIADAKDKDVVFQPVDAVANDTFAAQDADKGLAWTLGHVIVHATASSEESAALALELARGVTVEKRSRYETAWETVKTIKQCRLRLEESRRMRHAMLDAWPVQPSNISYTPGPWSGPVNAAGRFILGLGHEESHLGQLREIMQQARAARGAKPHPAPKKKPVRKTAAKKRK